jgi:hypothetical protein
MLHARHRLFVAALTAAAVLAGAANAPSAFAVSSTQESCREFVHTYLEGGLADGSTVTLALNVYSTGLPVAEVWDVPTVLTLRYPHYPVVAGWLISAATDSRGTLISADDGQLKVLVQTESSEPAVEVLGCRGPSHLYGLNGNEILGLAFGQPEPPHPPPDSSNIDWEWAPAAPSASEGPCVAIVGCCSLNANVSGPRAEMCKLELRVLHGHTRAYGRVS